MHFVNPADNLIMDVKYVLTLIDKNIDYLDELYKDFNVLLSKVRSERSSKRFLNWFPLLCNQFSID